MKLLEGLKSEVFNDRKALHLIPEPGFEEHKTATYIMSQLDALGISYERTGKTGIVAWIRGVAPTKTLAFRTDMDGLSVNEESDYPEHSIHPSFMHACGHDGHMAMMLGLARLLARSEVKVIDNIVMIFQPAEEGPGGAQVLVEEGLIERHKIDEIYGIHVFPAVLEGKVGLCPGPMMAMTGEFDIDIQAKSAHGAMPHTGIDGIVIASDVVTKLQSIVSRNINPIKPAVLTIGRMEAGERRNIIAGKARLEGTIRAFDKEVFYQLKTRIAEMLVGIEASYGVKIEVVFRDMYPPVVNDQRLFNEFITHHIDECVVIEPQMISEDFSYYQERIPGLFYFIGTYNEEKGYVYPLHNSRFNFDDSILMHGLRTYYNILIYKDSIQI